VSPHPPSDLKSEARTSVAIASGAEANGKLLKSRWVQAQYEVLGDRDLWHDRAQRPNSSPEVSAR